MLKEDPDPAPVPDDGGNDDKTQASSTFGLLFFVVALIYVAYFIIVVLRTMQIVCNWRKPEYQTKPMRIFRTFYIFLWIQFALNFSLYFVLFGQAIQPDDDTGDAEDKIQFLTLLMIPSILMALDYALLYNQFEEMQEKSRIQGGIAYMKRFENEKVQKWFATAVYIYVALFVIAQVGIMLLCIFGLVNNDAFLLEFNILAIILTVVLNVNMMVFYCKNAGSPYKDEKARSKIHAYSVVVGVWTVAFIFRFIFNFTSVNLLNIDQAEDGTDVDEFWFAVETFANILVTELIPFYFVVDRRFVKIFTLNHLSVKQDSQVNLVQANAIQGGSEVMRVTALSGEGEDITDLENDGRDATDKLLLVPPTGGGSDPNVGSPGVSRQNSLASPAAQQFRVIQIAQIEQQFAEFVYQQERESQENDLIVKEDQFQIGDPYEKAWYPNNKKFLKYKLGSIFSCTYEGRQDLLVRVMDYDRISSYQIEAYFKELSRLKLYKLQNYVISPMAVYISSQMQINIVMPSLVSLHEMLHSDHQVNGSVDSLSVSQKLGILIQIARIMNTFHSMKPPMYHGNLNSSNIFVDVETRDNDSDSDFTVRIGEIEMSDIKKYANLFYSYRSISVSSPPECLENQRQRNDPTPEMDIYSFGMIMWEMIFEQLPFNGEISSAIEYIVKEDARPQIVTTMAPQESMLQSVKVDDKDGLGEDAIVITEDLANVIRRCWQTDPKVRPNFSQVIKMLKEQLMIFQQEEEFIDKEMEENENNS